MPSRADNDIFDFNDTLAERAAKAVTREQLVSLFDALDRADEQLAGDPGKATKTALRAVMTFLCASPHNSNGRFSRPLELLIAKGGQALARDAGSGGVNTRAPEHHIKAAAAFVVSQLVTVGLTRQMAASRVAEVLTAAHFSFGKRRENPATAILAWRRDYVRGIDSAALAYQGLTTKPPIKRAGNAEAQERIALKWLADLLARAGYGAVA